ncbi:MAG TPA: TetR/AcrR family transcriptional regulator [Ornithinibacter sp.]|nr:TetR/AcrR family transcriptional regulator [Ornithinibacter sp.]
MAAQPEVQHLSRPARSDRRKARTRHALVDAARRILVARGTTDVSIQQITDEADVGLGSFYNHFTTKAELFETAVDEVLEEYGRALDATSVDMDDAAEIYALGVRMTARLATTHPAVATVLVQAGSAYLASDQGLAPRARRDIQRGIDTGRFTVRDTDLALTVTAGAVLTHLEVALRDPRRAGNHTADTLAEMLLRSLGMPGRAATDVAHRPLPPFQDGA